MKKLFAILICTVVCITLLASCNKECDNHVDDNEDGICDACNFEYAFLFKLTYDKSGYELDRVGARYKGGDIIIPSKHKGLPVTQIGYGAFNSEKKLTSVVIPDSVTLISDDAFKNQTSLTSVNVGKNVVTIGVSAFEGCIKLKTAVIGDAAEYIYASAFEGCTALESVTLGKNVKEITGSAFENCTSLKTVTIPASIEKMGAWVFYGNNMTDIYFGVSAPGENWNEKWAEGLNESVNIHWDDAENTSNNNDTVDNTKVQTKIGEEAQLPQFMSLEVDRHNALSSGDAIDVDVYMGYIILNEDRATFSDIVVPEEDFENYTFALEINYNNEARVVAPDDVNYFAEYRCNMYQDLVQYNKYNTVQLDIDKMTGKSYGFVNVELYMISNTNQRYWVSAETLYYSVTETEIVFGLVSNPVATEGDPGIITKGWTYQEATA